MNQWQIKTVEEWDLVARSIVLTLHPGDVLALQGPLGAGKTTFVQALARVMGSQATPKSPTFSLLRAYVVAQGGIQRLLHVDAYRIENEQDIVPLDLDEELAHGDAILVLEWPEHVPAWLARHTVQTLQISITKDGREAVLRSPA